VFGYVHIQRKWNTEGCKFLLKDSLLKYDKKQRKSVGFEWFYFFTLHFIQWSFNKVIKWSLMELDIFTGLLNTWEDICELRFELFRMLYSQVFLTHEIFVN